MTTNTPGAPEGLPHRKNFVVDASVFVSVFAEADTHHSASRAFFHLLEEQSKNVAVIVSAITLLETANVLSRYGRLAAVDQALAHARSFLLIAADQSFIEQAVPYFGLMRLKTADAVIAACAALHDATLITWDMQLLREARKITRAETPKAVLIES